MVLEFCGADMAHDRKDHTGSRAVAHLLDQAGWHGARHRPSLPPRAPELNGQENISQFMRQNWLSNRIVKSFDDIIGHCATPGIISSIHRGKLIGRRDLAAAVHSFEDWYYYMKAYGRVVQL
jgi:hypothetical protein